MDCCHEPARLFQASSWWRIKPIERLPPASAGPKPCAAARPLVIQLQGQLEASGCVDLTTRTAEHTKRLALQLRAPGPEPYAVEDVECLGAEFELGLPGFLADGKTA